MGRKKFEISIFRGIQKYRTLTDAVKETNLFSNFTDNTKFTAYKAHIAKIMREQSNEIAETWRAYMVGSWWQRQKGGGISSGGVGSNPLSPDKINGKDTSQFRLFYRLINMPFTFERNEDRAYLSYDIAPDFNAIAEWNRQRGKNFPYWLTQQFGLPGTGFNGKYFMAGRDNSPPAAVRQHLANIMPTIKEEVLKLFRKKK